MKIYSVYFYYSHIVFIQVLRRYLSAKFTNFLPTVPPYTHQEIISKNAKNAIIFSAENDFFEVK